MSLISNNKGMAARAKARLRRQARGRKKIFGTTERPRLVVTRSARHILAQVIDDTAGHTLAAASTMEAEVETALELLLEAGTLLSAEGVKSMVTDGETLAAMGMDAPLVDLSVYDNLLSRQEGCI